jgi:hypothetical protein
LNSLVDAYLSDRWHEVGSNASKSIRLIKCYFAKVKNNPIRGKLHSYFAPVDSETVFVEKPNIEFGEEIKE